MILLEKIDYKIFNLAIYSSTEERCKLAFLSISICKLMLIIKLPGWVLRPHVAYVQKEIYGEIYGEINRKITKTGSSKVVHKRVYGISLVDNSLQFSYGAETGCSDTEKKFYWTLPWKHYRLVRHQMFDQYSYLYKDLPLNYQQEFDHQTRLYIYRRAVRNIPKRIVKLVDRKSRSVYGIYFIEEREWHLGSGLFVWLRHLNKPHILKTISLHIILESTIKISREELESKLIIDKPWNNIPQALKVNKDEKPEDVFKEYCHQNYLRYIEEVKDGETIERINSLIA